MTDNYGLLNPRIELSLARHQMDCWTTLKRGDFDQLQVTRGTDIRAALQDVQVSQPL